MVGNKYTLGKSMLLEYRVGVRIFNTIDSITFS